MTTQYSNKPIVLDDLVYALDFGNQKSYVSGSSVARSLVFNPTPATFQTVPAGDYQGLAAAYSVRKVVSSYTGSAMQVQSASATLDIGFDSNGNLDTGSLLAFAGSKDAFVRIWYDQSGNGRNATQTTTSDQPKIVNSGSIYLENNIPIIKASDRSDVLTIGGSNFTISSAFSVQSLDRTDTDFITHIGDGIGNYFAVGVSSSTSTIISNGGGISTPYKNGVLYTQTTRGNFYNDFQGQNLYTALGANYTSANKVIGYNTIDLKMANIQELLVYSSNQSSNRIYIENNINTYYNIFTSSLNPTPVFDSRFLNFTSPDALLTNQTFTGFSYDRGNSTIMYVGETKGTSSLFTQDTNLSVVATTSSVGFGSTSNNIGRTYPVSGLKHVALRFSSGSVDCFVNGIPVPANSVFPTGSSVAGGRFAIPVYTGSLGLIQVYNRPLTGDEIWNNYQLTAPRYGLGAVQNKPYTLDDNAYLFLSQSGITDPIITSSIDTFVRGLKSASLWDKMIAIYPFVGTGSVGTNLTGSHRWNLKEPSLVTYPLTFTGSWNGSTSGSTPSGSNTNISIGGITPSQYYPFFNTQSAHISILSYDTPVSRSYLMGTGMTEELALSTLAGDYGTPAAAYSVRKVRTAYSGALMDVRRSYDNVTSSIVYVSNGDLDTGSLLDWVIAGRTVLPGAYSGLAAAYSLRRVSGSYTGSAIRVRGDIENQFRDIGFDASGNLDTGSLLNFTATGSNTLAGSYSGLAAAYSLRRVVPGYAGDAIEVQSGSVSQSIGFDSIGNLDTGSLLTFVGSGNAFVKTWYDQSGNNRHATQSIAASQPQIVSGGSIISRNGKSVLRFDGTDDKLLFTYQWANQTFDVFSVIFENNVIFYESILSEGNSNSYLGLGSNPVNNRFGIFHTGITIANFSSNITINTQFLTNYYSTGITSGTVNVKFRKNNDVEESATMNGLLTDSNSVIGASGTGDFCSKDIQELLLYTSSQDVNLTYISNNINAYYNIYTTSSVSTENAFVNTWYDQSGNNRHATQTATGSQPLIVSSGSLVTENGRPAVLFDRDTLTTPYFLTPDFNAGLSILTVYRHVSQIGGSFNIDFIYSIGNGVSNNTDRTNQLSSIGTAGNPTSYGSAFQSQTIGTSSFTAGLKLFSQFAGNTSSSFYENSTLINITSSTYLTPTNIPHRIKFGDAEWSDGVARSNYKLQEFILYTTSSVSASRPLIENNINNYYNIYTGSNHGFVARWYDQSGNNRHATQTATGSQPIIVESGSVIFEGTKPSLGYDGSNDYLIFDEIALNAATGFLTLKRNASPSFQEPLQVGYPSQNYAAFAMSMNEDSNYGRLLTYARANSTADGKTGLVGSLTNYKLFSATWNGSGFNGASFYKIYDNNTLQSLSNSSNVGIPISTQSLIGASYNSIGAILSSFSGKMQEVVLYPTDQSSIIESIHYGINSYYNIYPQTSSFATSSFTISAASGSVSASLNNRLTSGISTSGPLGLITVSRTVSNSLTIARNGVTSSFAIPASDALSTGIYLGAINNNSITLGNSPLGISFASVGTGLTEAELMTYKNLVSQFVNNFGRDLDALNFISVAGISNVTQQQAIIDLSLDLKRYGLWNKMKAIYPFIGGTAESHKWNLKDPRDVNNAFRLTFTGGWSHSSLGAKGNASTAYADTNFNPDSNFADDKISFSTYTGQYTTGIDIGASGPRIYHWRESGLVSIGNSSGVNATMSSLGMGILNRNNSNIIEYKNNNNTIQTITQTSQGRTNGNFILNRFESSFYSNAELRFAHIGENLTNQDIDNLYTTVQRFQTALGRQV